MNILIINGPNLNMLGIREKEIYGTKTYDDLLKYIDENKKDDNIKVVQSNSEGEIINMIQSAFFNKFDAIIINPGAYTHYSYAIMDAIKAINIKTIEVHLTNINKRERFRKKSVLKTVVTKRFFGKGFDSYLDALCFLRKNNGI